MEAQQEAQARELHTRLQKRRLEKQAELQARQTKEMERELQEQEDQITRFQALVKEKRQAAGDRAEGWA